MAISVDIIRPVTRNILRNPGDNPFGGFLPSDLGNLAAWYRFNQGITVVTGVSQWDDQSGNARHLLQATGSRQPSKESDGSILFDGLSQFLKTNAFTLNQPCTFYLLVNQKAWAGNDHICDGNVNFSGFIRQNATTSGDIEAGSDAIVGVVTTGLDGNYHALVFVDADGAGVLQHDYNPPATGDPGSAINPGGFTLAARGAGATAYSNIQVKEVIIYSAAHDAATRTKVLNYLNTL